MKFNSITKGHIFNSYFSQKADPILVISKGVEYLQMLRVALSEKSNYIIEERLISDRSMVKHFQIGLKPLGKENFYLSTSIGEVAVKSSELIPEMLAKEVVSLYLSKQSLTDNFNLRNVSRNVGLVKKGNGLKLSEYLGQQITEG